MSNPLFTKNYSTGRLKFQVKVYRDQIDLTRLPLLECVDYCDQMCTVYLKETLTCESLGWEESMTSEEVIESIRGNAGRETSRYILGEYIGREGSSENLSPDIAIDGFLDRELDFALDTINEDDDLYKKIKEIGLDVEVEKMLAV